MEDKVWREEGRKVRKLASKEGSSVLYQLADILDPPCDCMEWGLYYVCCGADEWYQYQLEALATEDRQIEQEIEYDSTFRGQLERLLAVPEVEYEVPGERARFQTGLIPRSKVCSSRFFNQDRSWKCFRNSQYKPINA